MMESEGERVCVWAEAPAHEPLLVRPFFITFPKHIKRR